MHHPIPPDGLHATKARARLSLGLGIALLSLVLGLFAALTVPLTPLFDPDEGYYPATAAETLRSGSFWDPQFNGAPRWEKPILSYALIEAAFVGLGESVTAARLPSVLQGVLLIAIVGVAVARLAGARAALLSTLVVGTTLGVSIFSRVAHPEIAVVLSIVTTELLLCLWLAAPGRHSRRGLAIAAGAAVAYGVLAKGPVAVVLPFLALMGALPFIRIGKDDFSEGISDAALAAAAAVALASPWYVAMVLRHGPEFLHAAVWQQNVGRYSSQMYGHRAGPFFLVLPALAGLLPWTAFVPSAIGRLRIRDGSQRDTLRRVMLAGAATSFVFYSLSSSKLASYALVCVPPLAILVGLLLDEDFDNEAAMTGTRRATTALLGVCAVVLLAAPFAGGRFVTVRQLLGAVRPATEDVGALLGPLTIPLGGLLALAAIAVARMTSSLRRVLVIGAVGALAPVIILAAARPILDGMYPWAAFGEQIATRPAPVWLLGRRAPSLTFYAGQEIFSALDRTALEADVSRADAGWLALTRDDWAQVSTTEAMHARHAEVIAARGRMVLVWFSTPTHALAASRH